MEMNDVVGIWKKYDKGSTWYSITTYRFRNDGTYTQTDETSGMAGPRLFEQQGTFKIIGPPGATALQARIEMVSGEQVRSMSIFSLGSKEA